MRKVLCLFLVVLLGIPGLALAGGKGGDIKVNESANGKTISLKVGQKLFINLVENPSTGYKWLMQGFEPSVLEDLETVYDKPVTPAVGEGTTVTYIFKGKGAGKSSIKFIYQRPWAETLPPEKKFSLTVNVTEPPPSISKSSANAQIPNGFIIPNGQEDNPDLWTYVDGIGKKMSRDAYKKLHGIDPYDELRKMGRITFKDGKPVSSFKIGGYRSMDDSSLNASEVQYADGEWHPSLPSSPNAKTPSGYKIPPGLEKSPNAWRYIDGDGNVMSRKEYIQIHKVDPYALLVKMGRIKSVKPVEEGEPLE